MSLHDDIMNLQCNQHLSVAWKNGHKQARHDAAELAIKFEQQRDELLEALEIAKGALAIAKGALAIAKGALADIAFSEDMTLTLARKKAKRIYADISKVEQS